MSDMISLSLEDAQALAIKALCANKTSEANATSVARALVAAEADGQSGHGLARLSSYTAQARIGKVDGHAIPEVEDIGSSSLRVDGGLGFAYPAIDLAIKHIIPRAKEHGITIAVLHRSHHFGQAGAHVERLAEQGLIGLTLGNTPQAMAFWGGTKPRLGTNPLAFACPLSEGQAPLVIDLALSVAARGKIMAAKKQGKAIPKGWALDADGQPTTDAQAALSGSMLPIGGAKGAALALMVEILAAGLSGSHFGWQASSFLDDKGPAPDVGQILIAIDANSLSGGAFPAQIAELLSAMAEEDGVRLPGTSRLVKREAAARDGLPISRMLYQEIQALIG
ncbi:MAG: Ldh family oxidoreductase [Sphingomonadales bacterium]|jgi:(2R)-3-sulfolactate dehydrogenase (NADP+)